MTARTSQVLADKLRAAGAEDLAKRAELDEFHDYRSPHDLPQMVLDLELLRVIQDDAKFPKNVRDAVVKIREQFHMGVFDADLPESNEWAASPEGRAAFSQIWKK